MKSKQQYFLHCLSLLACLLSLLFSFVFFYFEKRQFLVLLCFAIAALFFIINRLNSNRIHIFPKQLYFHILIPLIALANLLLPAGSGLILYYIPALLLVYFMYDIKKERISIVIHHFEFLFGVLLVFFYQSKFGFQLEIDPSLLRAIYFSNILLTMFLSAFAGYYLVVVNRRNEQKLALSQAKLNALFDSSIETIFYVDTSMKLIWYNAKAFQMVLKKIGNTLKIGQPVLDFVSPDFQEIYEEKLNLCLQGNFIEYERKIELSPREIYFYELQFIPVYDEHQALIGAAIKGLDITQKKATREREMSILLLKKQLIKNRLKQKNLGLIIHGQEMERQKISEEFHSGIAQMMTILRLEMFQLNTLSSEELTKREQSMKQIIDMVDDEVKRISNAIMPGALMDLGLVDALQNLFIETSDKIHFTCDLFVKNYDWPEKQKISIYRIVQGGLSKAIKSQTLTGVDIQLQYDENENFLLEMNYYGLGEENDNFEWLGLNDMKQRAELIHATFDVFTIKDADTRLTIEIPMYGYKKGLIR